MTHRQICARRALVISFLIFLFSRAQAEPCRELPEDLNVVKTIWSDQSINVNDLQNVVCVNGFAQGIDGIMAGIDTTYANLDVYCLYETEKYSSVQDEKVIRLLKQCARKQNVKIAKSSGSCWTPGSILVDQFGPTYENRKILVLNAEKRDTLIHELWHYILDETKPVESEPFVTDTIWFLGRQMDVNHLMHQYGTYLGVTDSRRDSEGVQLCENLKRVRKEISSTTKCENIQNELTIRMNRVNEYCAMMDAK